MTIPQRFNIMSESKKVTDSFPWVSKEEYVAHYSRALAVYMEQSFPGSTKNHMTDLAASSSSFSDAWWAIFDNIDYT